MLRSGYPGEGRCQIAGVEAGPRTRLPRLSLDVLRRLALHAVR